MKSASKLQLFKDAQTGSYDKAFTEIAAGKKASHWMWFIFPQLSGLGFSEISRRYGISSLEEAEQFLNDEVLGPRLIRISELVLKVENKTAHEVFGSPDDMKLRSSMTLFSLVPGAPPVFQQVLDKFYDGKSDPYTVELIQRGQEKR